MKCKLCLQEKELLKKSHIIPNFMYKGLFDKDHSFYKGKTKTFDDYQKLYSGEYEANILCKECDNNKIGQFESYASIIFNGGELLKKEKITFEKQINQHGVSFLYCKNIDYKKFKLFLLSILWKSSISQRKFFEHVSLGPHEKIIRQMIMRKNAGVDTDYLCTIMTYRNSKKDIPSDFIGQPLKRKDNDGTRYIFLIGGFCYTFLISKHAIPPWIYEIALNSKGEMKIVYLPEGKRQKLINYFLGADVYK